MKPRGSTRGVTALRKSGGGGRKSPFLDSSICLHRTRLETSSDMNFGVTFDVESPFGCDVFYVVEERLMYRNVKDAKVPEI